VTSSFDTLIYTDCRAGQGLLGTAGLQFQACSSDGARGAMGVVRRSLLYEAPARWMQERRPPEEYPASFAHVFDGYFATATGVYLGREVSGHREGNQLTHSIVTQDATAYGHVRPAQLFRAPFWTAVPAPTTTCPALAPGWQPGPLDATSVQRFVASSTGGVPMLTALLSALHRLGGAGGQRVLFLSRDPEPVLRWLAAATLLVPRDRALRIGFKVFTTNPAYAPQHVLAIHPDWSTNTASVANDLGYAVFDLTAHEWSRVEPTPTAPLWAQLFCAEDPYDVIDAVEVAAASELPDPDAAAVACASVLGYPLSPAQATAAARWLRNGPSQLIGLYGDRVAGRVLDNHADELAREAVTYLDEAVRRGRLPDRTGEVLTALVKVAVEWAMCSLDVLDGASPGPSAPAGEAASRLVTDALATASPRQFEAVLRVAARFGILPDYAELADAVDRFVEEWRDHPDYRWRSGRWPDGAHLEQRLRDRLNRDLVDEVWTADEVGDAWGPYLDHRPPPPLSGLDEALVMAKVWRDPNRRQLVESWVRQTLALKLPTAQQAWCVSLPWRRTEPTVEELLLLCQLLPAGASLEPYLFTELVGAVDTRAASPAQRDAYDWLVKRGLLIRSGGPENPGQDGGGVDQIANLLLSNLSRPVTQVAALLRDIPQPAAGKERADVIGAMLSAPRVAVVLEVLQAYPALTPEFADHLHRALKDRGEPVNAAAAFLLTDLKHLPRPVLDALPEHRRAVLRPQLEVWVERASQRKLEDAAKIVRELDRGWLARWRQFVRAKSRHASWFDRVTRGWSG